MKIVLVPLYNLEVHKYLSANNPEIAFLFDQIGTDAFKNLPKPPYVSLIGSVIGQIVRYEAAKTIRSNLYRKYGNYFTIDDIVKIKIEEWMEIGLSKDKIDIILRINDYILKHPNWDISDLKSVRGIGEWTITTTILISFKDWDVFPCGDLFIRKRLKRIYNLDKVPTIGETRIISEKYKPYRSVVAWYLWRWFD